MVECIKYKTPDNAGAPYTKILNNYFTEFPRQRQLLSA